MENNLEHKERPAETAPPRKPPEYKLPHVKKPSAPIQLPPDPSRVAGLEMPAESTSSIVSLLKRPLKKAAVIHPSSSVKSASVLRSDIIEDKRCLDHDVTKSTWIPTWLISLGIHLLFLLLFALVFTGREVTSPPSERTADVGIVLKKYEAQRTLYENAQETLETSALASNNSDDSQGKTDTASQIAALLASDLPPKIPDAPSELPGITGIGSELGGEIGNPGIGISGIGVLPDGGTFSGFGTGKVFCFNTSGEGRRFAYVFDHSGSMGSGYKSPLQAAKTELMRSVQSLQSNQSFQLVFYNDDVLQWPPKLATDANKRDAYEFISSITSSGGTAHVLGLNVALAKHPDVIFFLTDADEPPLTAAELDRIHRIAAGTQINTIHFGDGPKSRDTNFLEKLATQNKGEYVYIDVRTLK